MQTKRLLKDRIASKLMLLLTVSSGLIVFVMAFGLYQRSRPILAIKPLSELLFSTSWHPLRGEFGFFPFIMGTLWVTGVAVAIAIPLCLLTAIYLSEYAHRWVREWTKPLIDLLAGIPSVVYGVWGVLIIVPLIKDYVAPFCGTFSSGYSVLAGGVVLAIMVFPIIIHVSVEVFRSVPYEVREASLALGATKWQTVKHVVMRKALPGVIAAIVLGLSRAFGETMAVLMVAGNVAKVPSSILDPAYPLPALIANNYGEMLSVPLYDSALLLSSLALLLVVLFFNIISRVILIRVERSIQ
ncbi:MAG: phosphate ABC transporter permease [candidate division Zixibacteria bacterium DG_27]|nr:MAG: phosphate ABC transporter permease [candidate division Zixibacteria bacterium DG_27]